MQLRACNSIAGFAPLPVSHLRGSSRRSTTSKLHHREDVKDPHWPSQSKRTLPQSSAIQPQPSADKKKNGRERRLEPRKCETGVTRSGKTLFPCRCIRSTTPICRYQRLSCGNVIQLSLRYRSRAFPVAAIRIWNTLRNNVVSASSADLFQHWQKTFLDLRVSWLLRRPLLKSMPNWSIDRLIN